MQRVKQKYPLRVTFNLTTSSLKENKKTVMRFKNNNKKAKFAPTANSEKSYKYSAEALSSAKHIVLMLRIAGEF